MTFKVSEQRLLEMLAIEEECNCEISAGADYDVHLGDLIHTVIQSQMPILDAEKLMRLLNEELGDRFPQEVLEKVAIEMQAGLHVHVEDSAS